ncbi:hypothetical protein KIPB_004656 [Kipferlia bialata]|uniref:Six-bladed beta-propeller, TolB-like n=1 Tax=Kipferlia bialata TaxID=797122 RepID=A0A9K3GHZ1_9EUKA|nr:hypothetical protein KIPB_004656 [Kipferlia bialata]|eukprot:g4656.t1
MLRLALALCVVVPSILCMSPYLVGPTYGFSGPNSVKLISLDQSSPEYLQTLYSEPQDTLSLTGSCSDPMESKFYTVSGGMVYTWNVTQTDAIPMLGYRISNSRGLNNIEFDTVTKRVTGLQVLAASAYIVSIDPNSGQLVQEHKIFNDNGGFFNGACTYSSKDSVFYQVISTDQHYLMAVNLKNGGETLLPLTSTPENMVFDDSAGLIYALVDKTLHSIDPVTGSMVQINPFVAPTLCESYDRLLDPLNRVYYSLHMAGEYPEVAMALYCYDLVSGEEVCGGGSMDFEVEKGRVVLA